MFLKMKLIPMKQWIRKGCRCRWQCWMRGCCRKCDRHTCRWKWRTKSKCCRRGSSWCWWWHGISWSCCGSRWFHNASIDGTESNWDFASMVIVLICGAGLREKRSVFHERRSHSLRVLTNVCSTICRLLNEAGLSNSDGHLVKLWSNYNFLQINLELKIHWANTIPPRSIILEATVSC